MAEIQIVEKEKLDNLELDFNEKIISVDSRLVKHLKDYQASGDKFMWDTCIKPSGGSGCILAHCMGSGKTLQVVALVHTLLKNQETKIKNVMIVCPLIAAFNWVNEFNEWLKQLGDNEKINLTDLTKCKNDNDRLNQLKNWEDNGGVLIIHAIMFRTLTKHTEETEPDEIRKSFLKYLRDPGPDLVVCDEAQFLKNKDTDLSNSIREIKTNRRIALTGIPLQNNLIELYNVVQFVKPNFLGIMKQGFTKLFVKPIENGFLTDSTPEKYATSFDEEALLNLMKNNLRINE